MSRGMYLHSGGRICFRPWGIILLMENCIFCKIVKGEAPSYKTFENENFYAFLDIYPSVKGHTLVIPKAHYQWVYEVPNFAECWDVVYKVTKAMEKVLRPQWINYYTFGLIPHAHIHILPRNEDKTKMADHKIIPSQIEVSKEELTDISKRLLEETQK